MRAPYYILDSLENPIGVEEVLAWAKWNEAHRDARRIGETFVPDESGEVDGDGCGAVRVSTVFIGIDHCFFGDGPPLLWETMIFGGAHDGYQRRYSTAQAARDGHAMAVLLAEQRTTPHAVDEVP